MKKNLLSVAVVTVAMAAPAVAVPQDMIFRDHLRCYKAKDSIAKATYTANLIPQAPPDLPAETGCSIRVPATLLCDPVRKENLNPPPTILLKTIGVANQFVCYKLKCAKTNTVVNVVDQFGSRSVLVKKPSMLCAPANVPI